MLDFLASSLSLRCFFFLISANRLVSCVVNSFLGLLGDLERDLDLDLWDLDETFLSLDTRSLSLVGVRDLSLMKGDLTKNVVRSKQTNFLSLTSWEFGLCTATCPGSSDPSFCPGT